MGHGVSVYEGVSVFETFDLHPQTLRSNNVFFFHANTQHFVGRVVYPYVFRVGGRLELLQGCATIQRAKRWRFRCQMICQMIEYWLHIESFENSQATLTRLPALLTQN